MEIENRGLGLLIPAGCVVHQVGQVFTIPMRIAGQQIFDILKGRV